MDPQAKRELELLTEIAKGQGVTQRALAKKLGMALGLTNLYIKRLARKGYVKIVNVKRSRLKYLLTPRGIAEKARLAYQYVEYSLSYYTQLRETFRQRLSPLSLSGGRRGCSEWHRRHPGSIALPEGPRRQNCFSPRYPCPRIGDRRGGMSLVVSGL